MESPITHAPQLIDFIQWGFYALISFFGWQIAEALKALKDSVSTLNEKVAVVIQRVDTHEKRLDKHDELIDEVQTQNPRGKNDRHSRN